MIKINRVKAEETVRDRLRAERVGLLLDLDVQAMIAAESGGDTSEAAAKKQALRDITEKDLSGLTIEQLSALTIAEALEI